LGGFHRGTFSAFRERPWRLTGGWKNRAQFPGGAPGEIFFGGAGVGGGGPGEGPGHILSRGNRGGVRGGKKKPRGLCRGGGGPFAGVGGLCCSGGGGTPLGGGGEGFNRGGRNLFRKGGRSFRPALPGRGPLRRKGEGVSPRRGGWPNGGFLPGGRRVARQKDFWGGSPILFFSGRAGRAF